MKHIVLVGATSAIAHECARIWVQAEPCYFTLIGRDSNRTERVVNDLKARSSKSNFTVLEVDFLDPKSIQEGVDAACEHRRIDVALIAHGSLQDQSDCQQDLQVCDRQLSINGVSPALFAEAIANKMANINYGSLALIGSVAGDRGRKSNYTYGSAKALIDRYAQGLQHRFASTNVSITLIKPGPTKTPMTSGLQIDSDKLAKVEDVAQTIVYAIHKKKKLIYVPGKWWVIMLVVRLLPKFIFNKLEI